MTRQVMPPPQADDPDDKLAAELLRVYRQAAKRRASRKAINKSSKRVRPGSDGEDSQDEDHTMGCATGAFLHPGGDTPAGVGHAQPPAGSAGDQAMAQINPRFQALLERVRCKAQKSGSV